MNVFREPEFRFAARTASGQLLVSCQSTHTVVVTNENGTATGEAITADFDHPQGIAVDPATDEIYVVDRYNHCVKVFDALFNLQRTFGAGDLNQPVGIALTDTDVHVANNENHNIAVFSKADGALRHLDFTSSRLYCPCGVALYKGLLLIAEWGNGALKVVHENTAALVLRGIPHAVAVDNSTALVLNGIPHAHAVAVDPDGNVYVAQYSDKKIVRLKIDTNADGSTGFVINDNPIQLDSHPTSLFWDDHEKKMGVVFKTRIQWL